MGEVYLALYGPDLLISEEVMFCVYKSHCVQDQSGRKPIYRNTN